MHDAEKLIRLCDETSDLDDTSEYQLLIRLLKERTITDNDGNRRLRKATCIMPEEDYNRIINVERKYRQNKRCKVA